MNVKTCPDCKKKLKLTDLLCECGYDYTMDDCPGCEKRIPEGTLTCPHCAYDILGPAKPKKPKKAVKAEEAGPARSVVRVRLSKIYVPSGDEVSKWPEWEFKEPATEANMLRWAGRLRTAAKAHGQTFTNHAIGYLADDHDNKELAKQSRRLVELLGGDDY